MEMAMIDNYVTLYLDDGTTLRFNQVPLIRYQLRTQVISFDYVSESTGCECSAAFNRQKFAGISYSRGIKIDRIEIEEEDWHW